MASKAKLNDDQTDKLIDLYQERPCLWDISDKSYQKKDEGEVDSRNKRRAGH